MKEKCVLFVICSVLFDILQGMLFMQVFLAKFHTKGIKHLVVSCTLHRVFETMCITAGKIKNRQLNYFTLPSWLTTSVQTGAYVMV